MVGGLWLCCWLLVVVLFVVSGCWLVVVIGWCFFVGVVGVCVFVVGVFLWLVVGG